MRDYFVKKLLCKKMLRLLYGIILSRIIKKKHGLKLMRVNSLGKIYKRNKNQL